MGRPRVLLIDPPSQRPVLRDYYCSTRPKAGYRWHPVDLLALATRLAGDVSILDCVSRRLDPSAARRRVEEIRPDCIVGLVSARTEAADLRFLEGLDAPRLVLSGEVALDPAFDFAAHPNVAGLLLDFTAPEAADFVLGEPAAGRVRTPDHVPSAPPRGVEYRLGGVFPALAGRYSLPLWQGGFASLLTDFGCTFACAFCNSGRHSIGHKLRALDEVDEEVAALAARGVRRLYLRDMTFGGVPGHTAQVLQMLARHDFALRAFLRADLVDDAMADGLAAGGLHLAQIGVEAPTAAGRQALGKQLADHALRAASERLRKRGIAVGLHFTVGAPGDDAGRADACRRYAGELGAAYCSINVLQQRHGCEPVHAPAQEASRRLHQAARRAMRAYNVRAPVALAAARFRRGRRAISERSL